MMEAKVGDLMTIASRYVTDPLAYYRIEYATDVRVLYRWRIFSTKAERLLYNRKWTR